MLRLYVLATFQSTCIFFLIEPKPWTVNSCLCLLYLLCFTGAFTLLCFTAACIFREVPTVGECKERGTGRAKNVH